MGSEPMVFVDIETNGQMGVRGRIIEVAVLRLEDGVVVDELKTLVNPSSRIE